MNMPSTVFLNEIRDRLNARGERMTRPRQAVLGVLADDRRHLSAEEIVAVVAVRDASVHRASVYRTLEALTHLGVVQHVHVSHGPTVYHLVDGDSGHLHLQCTSCGDISDAPSTLLLDVAEQLDRTRDFTLDLGHVALAGLCSTCRQARQ
jgi:Fur family transcriptional regulator, ferric uptake regulator